MADNGFAAPGRQRALGIAARLKDEQAADAARAVALVKPIEPAQHALATQVSERSGVPVVQASGAVKSDPRGARAFAERHAQLLRDNPSLARWIRDPTNAAVGQDDVPGLAAVAQASRPTTIIGALPEAASAGMANLGAQLYHLAVVRGFVSPEAGAAAVADFKRRSAAIAKPEQAEAFDALISTAGPGGGRPEIEPGMFRSYRQALAAEFGLPPSLTFGEAAETALDVAGAVVEEPGGALYATAENLPYAIPALAGGLGGGLAGGPAGAAAGAFGGSHLTEYGAWIDQRLSERGIDQTDEAALVAAYRDMAFMETAKAEANRKALGTAGVDALFSFLAGRKIAAATGKAKVAAGAKEVVGQAAGEVASEAAGQLAATGRLDVADTILEGLLSAPQSVAEVGIGAAVRGAAQSRQVAVGREVATQTIKAVEAQQEVAQVTSAGEAFGASKAATLLPERVRELVEASGPHPAPTVATEAWDAFVVAQGKSPAAEAERIGASYAEAQATGVLSLPYGRVVEEAKALAPLLEDMRFRPDLPTVREADEAAPELQKAMQEAAAAVEDTKGDPVQEEADEARAVELVTTLGLPPDGDLMFQSAAPDSAPEGGPVDQTSGKAKTVTDRNRSVTDPLRATADAIEAAAPGVVGKVKAAFTGAQPVAEAVRGILGRTLASPSAIQAQEAGGGGGPTGFASAAPAEALASAAQRDPAGTAAALRELADIRDRQAAIRGPEGTLRAHVIAAVRAAGRPANEAARVAAVVAAFVRTMEARYPAVTGDFWKRYGLTFARSAAPAGARQQGERAAFDPATRTIHFFDGADATSAQHEVAHWMLDTLAALAADPAAPEALKADYAAALEAIGGTLDTDAHERFARGFEAYLLTGEAPSAALRRVFAAVAEVMRRAYANIRALIGADAIDPKLRTVFDRLLATDAELAAAEAEAGLAPLFPTAEEMTAAGVDPEVAAKYASKVAAARDTAVERITRKVLATLTREKKAERNAVLDAYRAEIAARVDTLPAMVALDAMTGDDARVKIDYESAEQTLGDAKAKRLRSLGVTVESTGDTDAGLMPEMAAEMFGFDSAEALADALILAGNADKLVDTVARQRLAVERPDLVMERAQIAAEARRVATASREEVLSDELRILMELQATADDEKSARSADRERGRTEGSAPVAGLKRRADRAETAEAAADAAAGVADDLRRAAIATIPSLAVVREIARATLAPKKLREIRPSAYLMAVQREGRAAARHVAAGAYDLAAKAKSAQAMNLALYREATRIVEQAERDRRYLRRIAAAPAQEVLGRAGFTYKDQVNAILARFDLGRISAVEAERREALAEWIAYVEAETGRKPDIAPSVLREAERTNWRELPASRLSDVRDSVQSIYEIARTKDKLLKAKQEREVAQAADALLATAAANNKKLPAPRRLSETEDEKAAARWAAARGALSKVPQIARNLDGNVDGGVFWENLVRPVNDAASARRARELLVSEARGKLNKLFTDDERKAMQVKVPVPGVAESVSHADRLMILLNMGNDGNYSRLVGMEVNGVRVGGTLRPEEVEAIVAQATPADIEFVKGIWAIYESLRPDVFAMHERVTGARPVAVAGRRFSIRLANGTTATLDGGYFPIVYGGMRGEEMTAEQTSKQVGEAVTARSMTVHGHTEARQQFVRHPLLLDLAVIDRTLSQVILDLTHREALIDVQRLLRHDTTKEAIIGYAGKAAYDQFRALYGDIAADDRRFAERSDWIVNRIRRGTSSAILGAKLTTALVNVTGVTQSIERIGGKWYYEGLRHLFNDPNGRSMSAVMEWMYESSPFMRDRGSNVTRETVESARALTGEESSRIEAFNYWLYGRTQIMVDAPTWLGAYYKALDGGSDHDRAVSLADSAVREAQGSGDLVDLAAIQRGSAWRKLSTVFYHYASTQLARHSGAWKRLQVDDPSTYARFLADETLLLFLPITLGGALGAAFGALRGDEDDDYGLAERIAAGGLSHVLGLAPLLREMGGLAYGQFTYKGRPSDRVFTAFGQVAKEVYDATSDTGEVEFLRAFTGANMVGGIWFGYPADQINKTMEGMEAMLAGRANAWALILGPPRE